MPSAIVSKTQSYTNEGEGNINPPADVAESQKPSARAASPCYKGCIAIAGEFFANDMGARDKQPAKGNPTHPTPPSTPAPGTFGRAKSSSAPEKDRGEGTGTSFSTETKYTVVNKVTCYTEILSHPRCQEMQVNGRAMYMSAGREVTFEDILPNVQGLNKWQGKKCTMGEVKASYHGTDHNVWVICAETNMKSKETRTEYNFQLSNTLEAANARKKLADNERQQLTIAMRKCHSLPRSARQYSAFEPSAKSACSFRSFKTPT